MELILKKFVAGAGVVLGLVFTTSYVDAQPIDFLEDTAFGQFNAEDISILQQAITKANESGALNETSNWSNPTSGAKGSVTLLERLSKDGRPCARLRLVHEAKNKKGTSSFVWCRVESGKWMITH